MNSNINQLKKNIYVVKNIIDNDSVKKILFYAESLKESDWIDQDEVGFWKDKNHFPHESIDEVIKINNYVKNIFNNFISYQEFHPISRMKKNMPGLEVHKDSDGDSRIHYGLIFYLNDNYLGGEIFYPDLNFDYKPAAGDLLIHKGDINHGVREVKYGIRYMLTAFIHGDSNNVVSLKMI